MDPNAVVIDEWQDDITVPDVGDSGKGKTYGHRVVYADGREVWTYYRYNSAQGGGGDQVVKTETLTNKDQERRFKEARDAAAPPGGLPTRTVNGQVFAWNPETRAYDVPTGAAPVSGATAQAQPPKEKDENGRRYVWQPNPGGADAGGQWVDVGPSQAAPADQIGKPTGNTRQRTEGNTTVKETEYLLPDGTREWRTQTQTDPSQAADQVGKPTGNARERNEGGRAIKETEYVLPDGRREWRTQEGAAARAEREEKPYVAKNGKQYTQVTEVDPATNRKRTYFVDPATGQEVTLDEGDKPPPDMPPFRPDINKPGLGTIEYVQQLTALLSAGRITPAQYQQFVAQAQTMASSEASRLDTIASAQRQLQANEVSQRNTDVNASVTRLGHANTATQNALTTSLTAAGNFTPSSYAAMGGPILPLILQLQNERANAWGGMNMPAPVGTANYPALRQLQGMDLNSVAPTAAAPAVLAPAAPAPNAIGVGAIGDQPAPGAVQPAQPVAPLLGPPPPVTGPFPAQQPAQAAPQQPVNPPVGQPGNDPTQPVGQQQPAVLPAVLQAGVLGELASKYPPDVLAAAARSIGWI